MSEEQPQAVPAAGQITIIITPQGRIHWEIPPTDLSTTTFINATQQVWLELLTKFVTNSAVEAATNILAAPGKLFGSGGEKLL